MALFRQAGRKTWQARIWTPSLGRVVSVSTGTSDELEARRIENELMLAAVGKVQRDRVEEALNKLFDQMRERPALTLAAAEAEYRRLTPVKDGDRTAEQRTALVCRHWARFVEWCARKHPGTTEVREVRPDITRDFANALQRESASPKTAKNILFNVARLYRVVMPSAGVSVDPFHKVSVSVDTAEEVRALTRTEYEKLLDATAGTEYHGAIITGWYTGLRYADIAHLRWEQVGPDAIALAPHKTKGHAIRVRIPLHPKLSAYLDSIPKANRGEHVFPELHSSYGNRRTARRFMQACMAAKIGNRDGLTFHSIRHAFVTRLAAAGIGEDVRRKLVGHTQAATHDRYDHDESRARDAVNALE